jgi:XFP N-terminal domain/Acetokinase family
MKEISMTPIGSANSAKVSVDSRPLSQEELRKMNAYWRAANYLSVGQIYLYANPLLRKPLKLEHVKPRLLGHWGTTPGLNFIYVHFNRLINKHDLNVIYICGPGHGGPGMVANTYLEGTYTEHYPNVQQNEEGMRKLFKQFSFPGGIPSHAAPETPGSIHEGGELGYSLAHAYGAVFDNPDLLVCRVVGDGESETGPLATSWHSNKFLNPARDGAVLPILHLNGYKIANPTILGRLCDDKLIQLFTGYGYKPYFVEGDEPEAMHQAMAAISEGRSVDTTMGFTPLEGLMMGTRSGSVDPGILTYLMRQGRLQAHEIDEMLNQKSGLLGISGISGDMREILAAMKQGNPRARLAFDIYTHRLQAGIGAMVAVLEGIDALVFTAGVGENSPEVRSATCGKLEFLGLKLDEAVNARVSADQDIAAQDSRVRVLVIRAQEDWAIARECWKLA